MYSKQNLLLWQFRIQPPVFGHSSPPRRLSRELQPLLLDQNLPVVLLFYERRTIGPFLGK